MHHSQFQLAQYNGMPGPGGMPWGMYGPGMYGPGMYGPGMYGPGMYPQMNGMQSLIANIERAIDGEYHAIQYYTRLAELAPNAAARRTILQIRQDEIRHYNSFTRIFTQLTGRRPRITQGPLPATYAEGVRFAIRDELEAAAFYRQISTSTNIPRIRRRFSRAAADEQRHARLFQNLLAEYEG